jgi:hypothetical protein
MVSKTVILPVINRKPLIMKRIVVLCSYDFVLY